MGSKYFRLKLADMAEQLKTIRYTVQRTRNFNSTPNFFISDAKKRQKFKDAYAKVNISNNELTTLPENVETTRLFYQRYKSLYLNIKSENQKPFSYR
jgi:hypothetical protein